jgi:hypothetical protein
MTLLSILVLALQNSRPKLCLLKNLFQMLELPVLAGFQENQ